MVKSRPLKRFIRLNQVVQKSYYSNRIFIKLDMKICM